MLCRCALYAKLDEAVAAHKDERQQLKDRLAFAKEIHEDDSRKDREDKAQAEKEIMTLNLIVQALRTRLQDGGP